MLHRILLFTLLLFLIRHSSAQENDTLHYLFLGHPKLSQAGVLDIDPRVKGIEMEYYDRVWLGGDITGESNLNYSTLEYIDSLFDVSNPSNHWAFGNHDQRNYNTEWLREITQKNTFHTHFENGITTMVLNYAIPPTDCEALNNQFEMIQNVCDTISNSSHLIILSHNCVWGDVPGLPGPGAYAHANLKFWLANCYDKPADFYASIYPLLLSVKSKGITVINILGDTGAYSKGESMISDDGIYFIASGIEANTEDTRGPDKVLILDHHPQSEYLDWQFHKLDSLYQSFQ